MKTQEKRMISLECSESEIVCLKRELQASLETSTSLEKENQQLRREVARLKDQISSLRTHETERKSILWKKLHSPVDSGNMDASHLKPSSTFVRISERNHEEEKGSFSRPNIKELVAMKEKSSEVPKLPTNSPTFIPIKEVRDNKIKVALKPLPPPPPLPSKISSGSKSVRRVPEVVELYRTLTRKDSQTESKTNSAPTQFNGNMIGEIENRSSYLSAIKSDVERKKDFISFLIKEVESTAYKEISDVEAFVKWLDKELSSLVDERAVLKHFPQWPERKADALREAAFNYRDLRNLRSEVSSFDDNPKEPLTQALRRIQALQDRLEESINNMERLRDSTTKRYRDFHIPWEWMLDSGLIGEMKLSSLKLAREYMKRITNELQTSEYSREGNPMLQGVRFAYRVHQFAGGFDQETIQSFQELKTVGMGSHKQ